MIVKHLIKIGTIISDPIHATKRWRDEERPHLTCPQCERIRRDLYPLPLNVELKKWPNYRLCDYVWLGGMYIFHHAFMNHILEHLGSFVLGKCFGPDGRLIDEYVTCYTKARIVVRGAEGSKYRICNTCGAIPSGYIEPRHVLNSYLYGAKVYQDYHTALLVDEAIIEDLDFSKWPDAELKKVEIREEPLDEQNLPCDPPSVVEKYPKNYWQYSIDKEIADKIRTEFALRVRAGG
jgi:hypothetical protein